jgi:hypothetical protein
VASLKLAVWRAILVLHCCGRRGLTQALGGRKTFSNYVLSREALQASALLPSDSLSARPVFGYRMVRAQMLQALRLLASEIAIVD